MAAQALFGSGCGRGLASYIQNGIQHLQIRQLHVTSLNWQEFFDILYCVDVISIRAFYKS